jgi:hypothetical protein
MLNKLTAGIVALGAVGFASSAMAAANLTPVTVDLDVVVQEIAVLQVVNGTGSMIIDDHQDSLQGQPSSGASVYNAGTGKYATMRLNTNFDVGSISITYPKISNIRRDENAAWPADGSADPTFWFGKAEGPGGILGVWPTAGIVDETTGDIINATGGGLIGNNPASEDAPLVRTNTGGTAFGAGTHQIALGLSTRWSRTPVGAPLFAAPGTYAIELTATIVP